MKANFALPVLGATLASAAPTWIPASRFDLSKRGDYGTDFIACLSDAKLDPVVQGDSDYDTDATPFNLRVPWKPAALVYPKSAEDVSAAVKCAAASNVKTNARGGGHSYAAFALGGEDGHLTVSLDNLKDVKVDGEKASVGGGAHLGDVVLGLYNQGKRAMAHGTCPYVGIGGHAGHGGFGLPSRAWGLLLDQVYEVEVVTAAGDIVTANKDENSDLFWAIRGADSSFGIVTSFKTITHEAPEHNVWVSYTWNNFTAEQSSDGIQKWQKFAVDTAPELGLQIHINPAGPWGNDFVVDGVWYGDEATANATFAPLLEQLPPPNVSTVIDQNWLDSAELLAGSPLDTTNPDTHDTFFADSIMIPDSAPMTEAASLAFSKYLWEDAIAANDEVKWFVILDLYGGPQSYIRQVPDDETSFDARDTLYSIQVYGSSADLKPPFPKNGIPVIKGMVSAITDAQPETKFKGYVNYVDETLSREEAHAYYYPTKTSKLEQLKAVWDPDNLFEFRQGFLPKK